MLDLIALSGFLVLMSPILYVLARVAWIALRRPRPGDWDRVGRVK